MSLEVRFMVVLVRRQFPTRLHYSLYFCILKRPYRLSFLLSLNFRSHGRERRADPILDFAKTYLKAKNCVRRGVHIFLDVREGTVKLYKVLLIHTPGYAGGIGLHDDDTCVRH